MPAADLGFGFDLHGRIKSDCSADLLFCTLQILMSAGYWFSFGFGLHSRIKSDFFVYCMSGLWGLDWLLFVVLLFSTFLLTLGRERAKLLKKKVWLNWHQMAPNSKRKFVSVFFCNKSWVISLKSRPYDNFLADFCTSVFLKAQKSTPLYSKNRWFSRFQKCRIFRWSQLKFH